MLKAYSFCTWMVIMGILILLSVFCCNFQVLCNVHIFFKSQVLKNLNKALLSYTHIFGSMILGTATHKSLHI
jgi:hypothetical protein